MLVTALFSLFQSEWHHVPVKLWIGRRGHLRIFWSRLDPHVGTLKAIRAPGTADMWLAVADREHYQALDKRQWICHVAHGAPDLSSMHDVLDLQIHGTSTRPFTATLTMFAPASISVYATRVVCWWRDCHDHASNALTQSWIRV